MNAFEIAELLEQRDRSGQLYHEFLRVPSLSAGLYVLAAGSQDPQRPHDEDELYFVVAGRGTIQVGDEDRRVGPGSITFVPAKANHRFHSIEERLEVLVFFAPAESR